MAARSARLVGGEVRRAKAPSKDYRLVLIAMDRCHNRRLNSGALGRLPPLHNTPIPSACSASKLLLSDMLQMKLGPLQWGGKTGMRLAGHYILL